MRSLFGLSDMSAGRVGRCGVGREWVWVWGHGLGRVLTPQKSLSLLR